MFKGTNNTLQALPNNLSEQRKRKIKRILYKIFLYAMLVLGGFIFLLPFLWMLSTSFKEYKEIFTVPISWIPKTWTLKNYEELFAASEYVNLWIGFRNTIIMVVPSTIVGVLTAALAAFSFAKIQFPGRDKIFFGFVATMAIPGIITMIPSYMLYNKLHWTNTWLPLMVPGMFGGASAIFFTRQFMLGIPSSLEEAAKVDGMGWWGIFWKIEVPLSMPVLITNFMFGFLGGYNDYTGPMLYLTGKMELKTLQQMISMLNDTAGTKWGVQMAGACIATLPTLFLYLFAQRYFVEGISFSGVKE
ncbi:MAG: carbohydrate ABC transporter permease [Clostridia bacterium]|nr:carbohydrate ABC transporter permease [Clostridia bacterium]